MEEESETSNVLKPTSDQTNSDDNLNEDESTKRLLETLSSPSEELCVNTQESIATDHTSDASTGDKGFSEKDIKVTDDDLENSAIFQEIEKIHGGLERPQTSAKTEEIEKETSTTVEDEPGVDKDDPLVIKKDLDISSGEKSK